MLGIHELLGFSEPPKEDRAFAGNSLLLGVLNKVLGEPERFPTDPERIQMEYRRAAIMRRLDILADEAALANEEWANKESTAREAKKAASQAPPLRPEQ